MPYSGGGGGTVLGSVSTVSGTAAAGQVVDATSSSAASWQYPPGYEINYTQITATVNVTATAEASATTVISPGAITFDGTACYVEFVGLLSPPNASAGDQIVILLQESGSTVIRLGTISNPTSTTSGHTSVLFKQKITPTAAAHTYIIAGIVTNTTGTPQVIAGAGGSAQNPIAWVRFVKV